MRRITFFIIAFSGLFLALPERSEAVFVASDFEFLLRAKGPNIGPGEAITFKSIFTNVSAETAFFGTNIQFVSAGANAFVGFQSTTASPYVDSATFSPGLGAPFLNSLILGPAQSIEFDFFTIDTSDNIPDRTPLGLHQGSLGFENIPSTVDELVDISVLSNGAQRNVVYPSGIPGAVIPEPTSLSLLGLGLMGMLGFKRRF